MPDSAVLAGVMPEPGVAKPDPILVVNGVRRAFGGLTAVDVDHVEFQRGMITALIGPNGAGKTTFFNLLTGFDKPDMGTWSFDGQDLASVPAHKVARSGMVRTFQLTKSLARLPVIENMKLGATAQSGEGFLRALVPSLWRAQEQEIEERADDLLERFKLSHMRDQYAGTLSGGQSKLLEMARALMPKP
jgi:branched-chain amino acid transport system ATP-binding protein